MKEIWLATTNSGKVSEFKSLLMDKGFSIKTLKDVPSYYAPKETGETFEDNARIKAKALHAIKEGSWVIAEDSGLQVFGLNNFPGVHSARYAGDNASDDENNAKLLKMINIRTSANRGAQFICCIVALSPEGEEHIIEGIVKGDISKKLAGTEGFGYDGCFIPEGETQTFAELGLKLKNKVSHRAQAIRKLSEIL